MKTLGSLGVLPKEEILAEKVHKAYCEWYKKKKNKEYWTKGDYSLLNEETKEADRYTVRACLSLISQIPVSKILERVEIDEKKIAVIIEKILSNFVVYGSPVQERTILSQEIAQVIKELPRLIK